MQEEQVILINVQNYRKNWVFGIEPIILRSALRNKYAFDYEEFMFFLEPGLF